MLKQRPIVVAACCWVIGIYLAVSMQVDHALLMMLGIFAFTPLLLKRGLITVRLTSVYFLLMAAALFSFTLYDSEQVTQLPTGIKAMGQAATEQSVEGNPLLRGTATGRIHTTPERDGDRVQFQMEVYTWNAENKAPVSLKESEMVLVQLKLSTERELEMLPAWQKGSQVQIAGELVQPAQATNFGAFNYRQYLKTKHIYWLLQTKGANSLSLMSEEDQWRIGELPSWIMIQLERLRIKAAEVYHALFPPHESSYLEGLVLGLRSGLDPEIEQTFAQLGLTHVLAISGLHVGVFTASCLLLLRPFRLTRETGLTIVICLVPIYVLFTGASPSVIRAGVMAMLSLIGLRQGWLKDGLHLLSAALLLMLWWEPYYALDVSFQLSFAVTAGLVIGVPPAVRLLPARWPVWLRSSIAVTVTAQIVSFPLTVYYFNQISSLSLITNFALVPFISLIVLPLASLILLLSLMSIDLAKPLAWLTSQCNEWTFSIMDWLAQIEGTTVIWPKVPLWWILAYYFTLGMLLKVRLRWEEDTQFKTSAAENDDTAPLDGFMLVPLRSKRRWGLRISGLLSLFACLLLMGYNYGQPANTIISIIDVGQGDCTLIRTASGRNLLIDGGGTISFAKPGDEWKQRRQPYEVGEDRLVPLLKQRGVRHLDAVIVTHGDTDHAGGLRAVLQHIPVDRVVMNGTWKDSVVLEELYQIALNKRIPIISWKKGDYWQLDKQTRLDVLFPVHSASADSNSLISTSLPELKNQNEATLVLLLSIAQNQGQNQSSSQALPHSEPITILFTGDIGIPEERAILQLENTNVADTESIEAVQQTMAMLPKRIHMLKVAHHGSKSSSHLEWVERWRPVVSTISAGRGNRYGHPSPDALRRLEQAGSLIYRTDLDGEIQFKVMRNRLKVRAAGGTLD
ncbi:DNA internalization-related competence protein ComEC/Rec2 [Paenibacillus marinisediminis]